MAVPRLKRLHSLAQKVLLFAEKGPAYHYTYGRWRLRRSLHKWFLDGRPMSDLEMIGQFRLELPEFAAVRDAYQAGDAERAKGALYEHFQTRGDPRFFFNRSDIPSITRLVDEIDATAKEKTVLAADEICRNSFTFRRSGKVVFETDIDWLHRPAGNQDWTWDLNRHTFFETLGKAYGYTGDERYAKKLQLLLLDWMERNPPGMRHANWQSVFEVAFRINTWIWAFHLLQGAPGYDEKMCFALLKGLWLHGYYLHSHLELHTHNNHIILEAKSLAMLGLLFPEFKRAAQWRGQGLDLAYKELRAQVCGDGVHGERTTHYHRIITGELLELFVLLTNNGISIPQDVIELYTKMVEFELSVTKPDGVVSLLGDSAIEDVHLRFSAARGAAAFLQDQALQRIAPPLTDAEVWLLGVDRARHSRDATHETTPVGSRAFPDGGYFVMRSGVAEDARFLLFDCGPYGYELNAHHGHADALSIEVYSGGRTWIVDPGVYTTHSDWEWRQYFRGTQSHNTVVVDEQDQSLMLDSRRVYAPARATLHHWISRPTFDFVDGSHDGYRRLRAPVLHRRQIYFVKGEYWIVIDTLQGKGCHRFDLLFHLMPDVEVQTCGNASALCVGEEARSALQIVPLADRTLEIDLIKGATGPIQGWVSLYSGEKLVAPTLRYRCEAEAPLQLCSVLYPQDPIGQHTSITVAALEGMVRDAPLSQDEHVTAVAIDTDQHRDYLILDRGGETREKRFEGFQTDAELLFLRLSNEREALTQVVMRGGRQLSYQDRSLLEQPHDPQDLVLDYDSRL